MGKRTKLPHGYRFKPHPAFPMVYEQEGGSFTGDLYALARKMHQDLKKNPKSRPLFPGEKHLRNIRGQPYNYCGPGTKLQKRAERGDQPINKLDGLCRQHDYAYANAKSAKDIRKADRVFIKGTRKLQGAAPKIAKTAIKAKILAEKAGVPQSAFTEMPYLKKEPTDPAGKLRKKMANFKG